MNRTSSVSVIQWATLLVFTPLLISSCRLFPSGGNSRKDSSSNQVHSTSSFNEVIPIDEGSGPCDARCAHSRSNLVVRARFAGILGENYNRGELSEIEVYRTGLSTDFFSTAHLAVEEVLEISGSMLDDERVTSATPLSDVVVWQWADGASHWLCGQLPLDEAEKSIGVIEGIAFLDIQSTDDVGLPVEQAGGSHTRIAYMDAQQLVAPDRAVVSGKMEMWLTKKDGTYQATCPDQKPITFTDIRAVIADTDDLPPEH